MSCASAGWATRGMGGKKKKKKTLLEVLSSPDWQYDIDNIELSGKNESGKSLKTKEIAQITLVVKLPFLQKKREEVMSRHFFTQQEGGLPELKAGGKAAKGISITTGLRD